MKKHYLLLSCLLFITPVAAQDIFTNLSSVYSDIKMQSEVSAQKDRYQCENQECVNDIRFEQKMSEIGQKLSIAAFDLYPELDKRINYFQFSVVNKAAFGTASNAEGHIVVYRGVQDLMLTDQALSFVLAREMAHVIANHHHNNHATKLLVSALVTVLFPAVGVFEASASYLQTTAVTTVASSVTGEVAVQSVKPKHRREADDIALRLNKMTNHSVKSIASTLPIGLEDKELPWLKQLGESRLALQKSLKQDPFAVATVVKK